MSVEELIMVVVYAPFEDMYRMRIQQKDFHNRRRGHHLGHISLDCLDHIHVVVEMWMRACHVQTHDMSTEFYAQEIRRALEEQSFGIKSFTLLESDSGAQARATVILLEGQKITIKLNSQGYAVRPHTESRPI